jgi:excinuclease UvrABC nuclease subunit
MVTFINGVKKASEYRKFKVKSTEGKPDDFLSMKEVLTRRLTHLGEKKWAKPDLIIIDGGKGQLSSVMQIVEEMGVKVGKDDWEARNVFYVGKLPNYYENKTDRLLSSFLDEWNKADSKQKEKLRKGLGYNIGFR